MACRLLILGGSTQARQLVERIDPANQVIYSLAGTTTQSGVRIPDRVQIRRGGFGGVDGLVTFLTEEAIDGLIDTTHPYADTMHRHAIAACRQANVAHLRLERAPWTQPVGADWTMVSTLDDAVGVVKARGYRRVLLTTGRTHLEPWRHLGQGIELVVRSIDPADLNGLDCVEAITQKGPFSLADEVALVGSCDVLVTRNAGGPDMKIRAAWQTNTPVIVWERPTLPACTTVGRVEDALDWIATLPCAP